MKRKSNIGDRKPVPKAGRTIIRPTYEKPSKQEEKKKEEGDKKQ